MDRCPGCGSDNIYFSKKRQVYVCEDCELEFADEKPEIQGKTIFLVTRTTKTSGWFKN